MTANKKLGILLMFFVPLLGQAKETYKAFQTTTTTKSLVFDAIQGDGNSRGLLDDPVSQKIRRKFSLNPGAVVEGVVNTVSIISEDCSRLKLTLTVPEVKLSQYLGGPEEMFSMWYEFNMCKDGKPPSNASNPNVSVEKNNNKPVDEFINEHSSDRVQRTIKKYYGN